MFGHVLKPTKKKNMSEHLNKFILREILNPANLIEGIYGHRYISQVNSFAEDIELATYTGEHGFVCGP